MVRVAWDTSALKAQYRGDLGLACICCCRCDNLSNCGHGSGRNYMWAQPIDCQNIDDSPLEQNNVLCRLYGYDHGVYSCIWRHDFGGLDYRIVISTAAQRIWISTPIGGYAKWGDIFTSHLYIFDCIPFTFSNENIGVAEVDKFTPADVEIDDQFILTVTDGIDSVEISLAATAPTVANITSGLTEIWNDSSESLVRGITAEDHTTYMTLTKDIAGTFDVTPSTVDGGGTDDQTLTKVVLIGGLSEEEQNISYEGQVKIFNSAKSAATFFEAIFLLHNGADKSVLQHITANSDQQRSYQIKFDSQENYYTLNGHGISNTIIKYDSCNNIPDALWKKTILSVWDIAIDLNLNGYLGRAYGLSKYASNGDLVWHSGVAGLASVGVKGCASNGDNLAIHSDDGASNYIAVVDVSDGSVLYSYEFTETQPSGDYHWPIATDLGRKLFIDARAAISLDDGNKTGIPITGHDIDIGTKIVIAGTDNFDDVVITESLEENDDPDNVIVIPNAYVAEIFDGDETVNTGGNVYYGGGGKIQKSDADLTSVLWTNTEINGGTITDIELSKDEQFIYACSDIGEVIKINAETGAAVWKYQLIEEYESGEDIYEFSDAWLAISSDEDGNVFVGGAYSTTRRFQKLRPKDSEEDFRRGPQQQMIKLNSDGELLYRFGIDCHNGRQYSINGLAANNSLIYLATSWVDP